MASFDTPEARVIEAGLTKTQRERIIDLLIGFVGAWAGCFDQGFGIPQSKQMRKRLVELKVAEEANNRLLRLTSLGRQVACLVMRTKLYNGDRQVCNISSAREQAYKWGWAQLDFDAWVEMVLEQLLDEVGAERFCQQVASLRLQALYQVQMRLSRDIEELMARVAKLQSTVRGEVDLRAEILALQQRNAVLEQQLGFNDDTMRRQSEAVMTLLSHPPKSDPAHGA